MLDIVMCRGFIPSCLCYASRITFGMGSLCQFSIRFMCSLKYYKIYRGFLVKYAGLVAVINNSSVLYRICLPFRRTLAQSGRHCVKWIFLTTGIHVDFCLIYLISNLFMLHLYCLV